MNIVTAAQMQALDRRTIHEANVPSLTLMERAGQQTVGVMEEVFGPLKHRSIVVVCGKGHNGGDGLVIARLLTQRKAAVRVILLHPVSDLAADTKTMYRRFVRVAGSRALCTATSPAQGNHLHKALAGAELIVDALLGTGLSSPVTGLHAEAIEAMTRADRPIVAVDLPSGLHADSGAILGVATRAALTVTFGLPKLGLYLGAGIDHAGTIYVADIGIPPEYSAAVSAPAVLLTAETVAALLPVRPLAAHKGTFGHLGLIAGSVGKTGAAALAARAAVRTGAGLVTVATPAGANATLESKLLEAMSCPVPETPDHTLALASLEPLLRFADHKTALAIGPGLGLHPETVQVVQTLLTRITVPCVLDADALNALAPAAAHWPQAKAPLVVTPHPGEMARLSGIESGQAVNRDRLGVAQQFARTHQVFVVLKGARTIVAHPDGRLAICPTGNPGMATGGTGDVLTGIIGGLLAQGLTPWDAACAGTYLHGLAGDLGAAQQGRAGLIAGDLVDHLPAAIRHVAR